MTEKIIARRAGEITPFLVMDVLEKAGAMEAAGIDVIHLEVGEPDFAIPACVEAAMIRAAADKKSTGYTHSLGDLRLRQAICRHYLDQYGVSLDPGQVAVTSGTSPALMLALGALLDPGEEVILSDPHYACYPNFIRMADGRPVFVPVSEQDGFQLSGPAVQAAMSPATRAVLINSPANPTGTVLSPVHLEEIAGLGPWIISDEVYHGLEYGQRSHSILEYTDRAFVLNGFSKRYAMTGLRLGYLIMPPEFSRVVQILHQNLMICANAVVQQAGVAALAEGDEEVRRMRAVYERRRHYLVDRLKAMGFGIPVAPGGAFYVFANAAHLSGDSYALAFDILEQAHVGVAPGIDFGSRGEGFLRFSYANSMENISRGLDRLEQYVNNHT